MMRCAAGNPRGLALASAGFHSAFCAARIPHGLHQDLASAVPQPFCCRASPIAPIASEGYEVPGSPNDRTYDLATSLEVGQMLALYTILRVLGPGAMGQVYLATHPRLPLEDALKGLSR
jgi:hypothetical protein